jgi:enamine deaminase RidA (YjgF/YER057c/UK114 family)
MTPEAQLKTLGLALPPAPTPLGVYKPLLIDGKHCYVSGHGPLRADRSLIIGRVGETLTPEEGKEAARQVGLTILATLRTHLGSLDRVKRVIKVLGMVNCTPTSAGIPSSSTGAASCLRRCGAMSTASASQRRGHGFAARQHSRGN